MHGRPLTPRDAAGRALGEHEVVDAGFIFLTQLPPTCASSTLPSDALTPPPKLFQGHAKGTLRARAGTHPKRASQKDFPSQFTSNGRAPIFVEKNDVWNP